MTKRLHDLYAGLQGTLAAVLNANRAAVRHAGSKGDGSELEWQRMLQDHVPQRYKIAKGFVIDADGHESDQIDLIVYDFQYTPHLYNHAGQLFVPAESVYAVFEVKQQIDKGMIEYAGEKAASVRRLRRTSANIVHAGGTFVARPPFDIMAGILANETTWSPPFGRPFVNVLAGLPADHRIQVGCAASHGSFEAAYDVPGEARALVEAAPHALTTFLFGFLHRLQALGSVPAIDYAAYKATVSAIGAPAFELVSNGDKGER